MNAPVKASNLAADAAIRSAAAATVSPAAAPAGAAAAVPRLFIHASSVAGRIPNGNEPLALPGCLNLHLA